MANAKKPIRVGSAPDSDPEYLRGDGWTVLRFTLKGAQRLANRWASRSPLSGAVGMVFDGGSYYRLSVGAK